MDSAISMHNQIKNPETRGAALTKLAEWVKDTCTMMGSTVPTAYTVAAIFVRGLDVDIPESPTSDKGEL